MDAKQSATHALEVADISDAEKGKAYYRRAMAKIGMKHEESALTDLEQAAKSAPSDGAILRELDALKKRQAERAKKERESYKKMFG